MMVSAETLPKIVAELFGEAHTGLKKGRGG